MAGTIAFIGTGNMGEPMARNLLRAGFSLRVFNRTAARAGALAAEGAEIAPSATAAARDAPVVITMLSDDAALEEMTLGGRGIAQAMDQGAVHVSMSTVSAETSRKIAAAHEEWSGRFVAAPVFGRPDAAAARKLWICTSGAEPAKQSARPILEALGQGVFDFGSDPGAANIVKLCGNFLILAATEAIAEALALGEKSGLPRQALADFYGQTMFACPVYQNYGRIVANRSYEPAAFRMRLGLKDARLIRDAAEQALVPMPLADLLVGRVIASLARGRDGIDWSGIELAVAESAALK